MGKRCLHLKETTNFINDENPQKETQNNLVTMKSNLHYMLFIEHNVSDFNDHKF